MNTQILIVEDDEDILELLEYNLSNEGFDPIGFVSTKNVKKVLNEENIRLIIMDRNLPDIEGSEYIEMLRAKGVEIPVIFLSAKESKESIKEGFLRGGDDYITKPFDMGELVLRIRALLKRTAHLSVNDEIGKLIYRDITLDLNQYKVKVGAQEVELTKLEFLLLKTLIENATTVLDRETLIDMVWSESSSINKKTVNVTMKRLKDKIDPTKEKDYIKAIQGVGYCMG